MAEEFDQYAVGWDAIASADADPADEASWVPVRSQVDTREDAERMVWQLRDLNERNPAVRNVGMFGRPTPVDWTPVDPGPRPLPEPPVAPVVEDQDQPADQPADPLPVENTEGPPETADTPFEEPVFVPMDDETPASTTDNG
ncbi:hypothetical protein SEA_CAMBIARE_26 [Mycobacterium phage Cambiare]|uniref:Uncharacterized protein n=2 Tax=Avocadovirus TaxID=2946813 RepID=A0A222YZV6_9CAUD|nr:hypothetical protein AVT48_gp26 [Mycobacterium phage Cambiare]YP_010051497.1 hypothetical protein KDW73_gp25 [Mycobacterium phage Avocado]AKF14528.1 hypothetical protein SEA_CAMBIARE_26 [Mycobacterium phage Cambiare]ASR77227.1 hypothetical protein SEA_AVOCADO_25 [Mycobacterium phage Avocado]